MIKPDITIHSPNKSDKKIWDQLATHPLQSWAWGEFRKKTNVYVERLGVYKNENLSASWQISFHRIPHTPFTVGYFPKGPLPDKLMTEELIKLGSKYQAIYIQLEPNVLENNDFHLTLLGCLKPSHHPLFTKYTFHLDLTKSEADLLSAMHSKTRYNIRVAQKHGVVIKEDNSDSAFSEYLHLENETTTRQKFFAHNNDYHLYMWQNMKSGNIAHLFTAIYKGKTLAAWILFVFKDTLYYPYGASSITEKNVMAPNLMLWETALWGKKQGLKRYDLWGALGPNPNSQDPFYGFHRFKQGYNPELIEYLGSYDLVLQPVLYRCYTILDKIRWMYLKVKRGQ